eukprot:SAG11_NODE_11095_length_784_cov_0.735766_1_plen_116_part_01
MQTATDTVASAASRPQSRERDFDEEFEDAVDRAENPIASNGKHREFFKTSDIERHQNSNTSDSKHPMDSMDQRQAEPSKLKQKLKLMTHSSLKQASRNDFITAAEAPALTGSCSFA